MTPSNDTKSRSSVLQNYRALPLGILGRSIAVSGLVLLLFYAFLSKSHDNPFSDSFNLPFHFQWPADSSSTSVHNTTMESPTNISHIGFIVISSLNSWRWRKAYIESWWRPNVTRGYVFMDKEPTQEFLPWPATSPPFQVNADITKLRVFPRIANPLQVRMFHSLLDMYRVGDKDLRWLIMCDDDSLMFVDNLVEVLRKYDHTKYQYIGGISECVKSNAEAGLATLDHMAQSCFADLGIALSIEKGIHQIDLHGDISGFLSSHPQSPLLTLHHFDTIDPIFPKMDKFEAIRHIMKSLALHSKPSATKEKATGLSRNAPTPFFMFNTRWAFNNSCDAPHVFFFESIEHNPENGQVLTTYVRAAPRNLPPCSASGNHSADSISKIRVLSQATTRKTAAVIECCDVNYKAETNSTDIKIRSCLKDEVIA
uniref:Fringe-like glycosyltransferase domain-containing protein n=1 Tax=Salix viminalis TaxID=40686 RepID=A0A6N2L6B7_SALVM